MLYCAQGKEDQQTNPSSFMQGRNRQTIDELTPIIIALKLSVRMLMKRINRKTTPIRNHAAEALVWHILKNPINPENFRPKIIDLRNL